MLQGLTAHYLATDTYALRSGDTALVYAAAGGVGRLLVQIARLRGARVIAVVGDEPKAGIARQLGAEAVLLRTAPDLVEQGGGRGVEVVYATPPRRLVRLSGARLAPTLAATPLDNPRPPDEIIAEKPSLH